MKYKVGDKVSDGLYGKGKIIHIDEFDSAYLVEYETANGELHMGFSPYKGQPSRCWWYNENQIDEMLEPVTESEVNS